MKKFLLLTIAILIAVSAFSQTQKGYVKTKGRLDSEGNLIPGTPLSEVVVKVKNRNEVMSDKRGDFSFPMPDQTYYLESVAKNGYVLIDPDVLSKQYNYSKNKLVIALETKDEQIEDRMENFAKINAAQNEMIRKLRAEVKQLKEENKITEEEYGRRLQEIADMQMESQQLVEEMVDRYSKIDYDQLSEFDRQISVYILNGELHKADSLLNTKGDLGERAENLKKLNEANAKEREEITKRSKKLEKSEALALKERDDLANDYYHKFEICKLQHKNDSAAYYLELRAALDTTNVEWGLDAGEFIIDYCADYVKSMDYFQYLLKRSIDINGELHEFTAACYNNLGRIYEIQDDVTNALLCYQKALDIYINGYEENHPNTVTEYTNIGIIYNYYSDFDKALEYHYKALETGINILGANHLYVGIIYNNIGSVYIDMEEYDKALEYTMKGLYTKTDNIYVDSLDIAASYNNIAYIYHMMQNYNQALEYNLKALRIKQSILGDYHPNTALSYNNVGFDYSYLNDYEKALEYYQKALKIRESVLDDLNSDVASTNNNIGMLYLKQKNYDNALVYLIKASNIWKSVLGEENKYVALSYNNIGAVYKNKHDYSQALEYYKKSLNIYMVLLEETHPSIINCYNNIGTVYLDQKNYSQALECYQKILNIRESILGADHPDTKAVKELVSKIQQKLQESKKK